MEVSGQFHDLAALRPNVHRTGGYVDPKSWYGWFGEDKEKKYLVLVEKMNCDTLVVHSVVQSPHRLCYPSSDTTVGMFNFTWNFRFENTFVCFFVDTYTPSQLIGHCL